MKMSTTLPLVPVYLRLSVSQTTFETVRRAHNRYRGPADNPDEDEEPKAAYGVDLDALLEDGLLWGPRVDAGDVAREKLDATQLLFMAVGHDVPISEKGHLDVVCGLSNKVQKTQCISDATNRQSPEKEGKIG